MTDTA